MGMMTFLVDIFDDTCWSPRFGLGGLFAPGGIGRVSPTSGERSFIGSDCIAPFPKSLDVPADYTRRFARARTRHNRSSIGAFALTLTRVRLPVLFTICCERIFQLDPRQKTSVLNPVY
jgi:hypothetical protein